MKAILIFLLFSILSALTFAQAQQPLCSVTPDVTINFYLFDYSGGAESSDDSRFNGTANCGEKAYEGIFSLGEQSGKLYFLNQPANIWTLVY